MGVSLDNPCAMRLIYNPVINQFYAAFDLGLSPRTTKLTNTEGDVHGASQVIELNQAMPRPLYFSGWSKADNVTGEPDSNYGVYLDIYYTDGSALYGQVLEFCKIMKLLSS